MIESPARILASCLLLIASTAVTVEGQNIRRTEAAGSGWIGITANISATIRDGRESSYIIITGTEEGGPADMAGVVLGDSIYRIDGRRLTLREWDRLTSRLTPGDDVHFSVQRDGHQREVSVRVGLRPANMRARWQSSGVSVGYSYEWDAVQNSIISRIDSVRARYATIPGPAVVVTGDSDRSRISIIENLARIGKAVSAGVGWTGSVFTVVADSAGPNFRFRLAPEADIHAVTPPVLVAPRSVDVSGLIDVEAALPFAFYWLETPEGDSVKTAMMETQLRLARTQQALSRRQRELANSGRRRAREGNASDVELLRLREDGLHLQSEIQTLAARLKQLSDFEREERVTTRPVVVREREPVVAVSTSGGSGRSTFTARLVGRNFVAGAQLADLNPRLSEYFGVQDGVLVMQVLEGSPAAQAELTPGDVIVRVERKDITSTSELRSALSERRRGGTTITVIRRGDRIRLTLPR
ncbi:MAG: PDZ domain-containing protein [Longimicrobiales bacterium]